MSGPTASELHGVLRAPGDATVEWGPVFAPGAPPTNVRVPNACIAAGWHWRGGDRGIVARRAPLLWNNASARFVAWDDDQGRAMLDGLLDGTLIVASDEPVLLWNATTVRLRSSAAGGSTFYWTPVPGGWAFAQALPMLAASRTAAVDIIGLAEVARFGASYTERTVLEGIRRIPCGHELVLEGSESPRVRPYTSFESHPDSWDEREAREAIHQRLSQLAEVLPRRRHVMYSGGVDSSLLAQVFRAQSPETIGVNLSLRPGDPEAEHARHVADGMGLEVVRRQLAVDAEQLVSTIASYASPTLDFGILPMHVVGMTARSAGARTLVDGTGGDAWFGFGALANEPVWRYAHLAWPLRRVAARSYGRLAQLRDRRAWLPLKVMARAPRRRDAALAHLCASPLYDVIWRLPAEAWEAAERGVAATLDALLGGHQQAPWQRMVVADGVFIAGGAFAPKSGQWNLVRQEATVYPFLTPGLVDVARRLPRDMLLRNGLAKPLLKDLAVEVGIPREEIFRKKAGFQPPLAALVRDPVVRVAIEQRVSRVHELDPLMAPAAWRIIGRLLRSGDRPSIHVLYPFWNVLSMRVWLDELRSGAAARSWCG